MPAHRRTLSLLLALGLALAAGRTRADAAPHAQEWPVERNARLLRHREWKVGLWGFDGGIADRLQVGTVWWSWPLLSPNVHLKGLLVDRGPYHLALESSFFYLNLNRLRTLGVDDDLRGHFYDLPLELLFDARVHPRLLVGGSLGYSFSHTSPQYDPKQLEGSGSYDSLFLHAHLTARAASWLWVAAELDWLLYQGAGAVGHVEQQVDPFVYAEGRASAVVSPLDPLRGGAVTASAVIRKRRFGMRLGVGYGHLIVPRLRIVVPRPIPYGTLDLFARFGGPAGARKP